MTSWCPRSRSSRQKRRNYKQRRPSWTTKVQSKIAGDKLDAEVRKLNAETEKIKAEKVKLEEEFKISNSWPGRLTRGIGFVVAMFSLQLDELRVAVSVRVAEEVLLVEQPQRDALAPQLDVERCRARRLRPRLGSRSRRAQPRLEFLLAQGLYLQPAGDPSAPRPRHHVTGRPDAHVDRLGDLAVATALVPLQSKYLSGLSHGQSV